MTTRIQLGPIAVDVVKKDIKNIHLSVLPPAGRVRIAAPQRMNLETIRVFAISKLGWIKQQQKRLREQQRESPREYLDRESHYLWGRRYLLKIIEADAAPRIELKHSRMLLRVRLGADTERMQAITEEWYRAQIRKTAPALIAKWELRLGMKVERLFVQRMKTKWGSSNPRARSIRLNTELAKKPAKCLEYILVHEMVHFLEPNHGDRFVALMNHHMPGWRQHRATLNREPLAHESWGY